MSLGLKYWYQFTDEWDRIHCVQILKEGYSSTVTELTAIGDPPVLITKPSNGDKFQPIQGKEIALKILSETDMQFSEFFTANNRDYLIRYWIEDSGNSDLLTNGNFAAWTGDNPDDWTIDFAETANEYVTEDPSGVCKIVAPEDKRIYQVPGVTSGYPYIVGFVITDTLKDSDIGLLGSVKTLQNGKLGTYKELQIATTTDEFEISTGSTGGEHIISINDVSCKLMDKIFEGYMIPDMYYEPFTFPPYPVTLRATDGLGDLKNRLFESAVDTPYTDLQDLLDVIEICLDETGLALGIISACNIFETTHNKADTDDPLPQTYITQEVYRINYKTGWNCYDVLADIMKCMGAKLEQINGAWHIIPIRELAETSYDRRKYNSSGVYQSNDIKSPQLTITKEDAAEATLCAWEEKNQMLEIIPAYREFTILQDYGKKTNTIQNGSFEDDNWSDANTPLLWSKSAVGTWVIRKSGEAYMPNKAANIGAAEYLEQVLNNNFYKLVTIGNQRLKVEIKNKVVVSGTAYAMVRLSDGTTTYWLQNAGTWTSAGVAYLTGAGLNAEIITDILPLTASILRIYLYEVVSAVAGAAVYWSDAHIEIIDYFPENNTIKKSINTNYSFQPADKEINIGDLPVLHNEEFVYWGGLLSNISIALTSWIHKGVADNDRILNHTAADIENNYDAPTFKLRGTIHSKVMDFNTVIKEGNLSNKIFIPGQMTYNPLRGTWKGEWLEIVTN